jgi:glycosyltransferase involved in cell wall biosynthesis
MSEFKTLSIVITSYNYAQFLSDAIDSALNVKWNSVEVIVVDDGSTDHSRAVIQGYGDKVQSIFQENQGQRVACNVGFAACTGDAVIFLDSDDVLLPELAREVASVWHPQVSKVQVLMEKINEDGQSLQSILPRLTTAQPTSQIRHWVSRVGEYPTPPGSGNIYARRFLDCIMPLSAQRDSAPDSTYIAMAPFYGDVVTIVRPLVLYRIHGANDSNILAKEEHFGREVGRAIKRLEAVQDACRANDMTEPSPRMLRRGSHLLQLRAASLRLLPILHPLPGDSRASVLLDALLLPFRQTFEPLHRRAAMAVYTLLVITAPLPIARLLIRKRFQRH